MAEGTNSRENHRGMAQAGNAEQEDPQAGGSVGSGASNVVLSSAGLALATGPAAGSTEVDAGTGSAEAGAAFGDQEGCRYERISFWNWKCKHCGRTQKEHRDQLTCIP